MDFQKTGQVLMKKYGAIKGMQINATVIPNIVKDFEKMLSSAPAGVVVKETYKFDDIDGTIEMSGVGQKITSMKICGEKAL